MVARAVYSYGQICCSTISSKALPRPFSYGAARGGGRWMAFRR